MFPFQRRKRVAENKDDIELTPRKVVERILMVVGLIGTIVVIYLLGAFFNRVISPPVNPSMIYGTWVEQRVAPYSAERFTISKKGVSVAGAIVATEFKFDGDELEFHQGERMRHFEFSDDSYQTMQEQTNKHYQPEFRRVR